MRVLGVSPFHDSSVAIVEDGKIVYFSKEERLSGVKRDKHPYRCLDYASSLDDVDYAVISSPDYFDDSNNKLEEYIKEHFGCPVSRMCDEHHLSHASLAFYNSGFEKSLLFVIDRNGSNHGCMREAETVFIADYPHGFKPVYKSFWLKNIGQEYDVDNHKKLVELQNRYPDCKIVADSTMNITKVYETATSLIGQNILENGKTMGLAAYGEDSEFEPLFVGDVPNTNLFLHYVGKESAYKDYIFYQVDNVSEYRYSLYADYAYQVQKQTQSVVLNLVEDMVQQYDIHNVCVTGGYGLNVVTNEYLVKNLPHVNFYFEPLADDSGNSIGSAMLVYREKSNDSDVYKLKDTFFNHVKDVVPDIGDQVTTGEIASLISQQKIVAVYNGQAEAGPRALGNRSILFDARNPDAKQIINSVKNREWYRPFAGSVLKDRAKEYFEMHGLNNSPFMTVSFPVKEDKLDVIPGIVHVDNSCRIQTVDEDLWHYYELLREFERITGVPVLLNTSFNVAGNPLIETVEEAIDMFETTKIDVLWFPEKGRMLTGA